MNAKHFGSLRRIVWGVAAVSLFSFDALAFDASCALSEEPGHASVVLEEKPWCFVARDGVPAEWCLVDAKDADPDPESERSLEVMQEMARRFESESSLTAKTELATALARGRYPAAFELFMAELARFDGRMPDLALSSALIESMGELGDKRAAAFLKSVAEGDSGATDPALRLLALENLGKLAVPETFSFIAGILCDSLQELKMRISSARALAHYGGVPAAQLLADRLAVEKNRDLAESIAAALGRLGGKPKTQRLLLRGSPVFLQW